jgi:hypothetical protein
MDDFDKHKQVLERGGIVPTQDINLVNRAYAEGYRIMEMSSNTSKPRDFSIMKADKPAQEYFDLDDIASMQITPENWAKHRYWRIIVNVTVKCVEDYKPMT